MYNLVVRHILPLSIEAWLIFDGFLFSFCKQGIHDDPLELFYNLIQLLSDEQKNAIRKMGLGSLLELKCSFSPIAIYHWLAFHFDTVIRTINLENSLSFRTTPSTIQIGLGIPMGSKILDKNCSTENYNLVHDIIKWEGDWPFVKDLCSMIIPGMPIHMFAKKFFLLAMASVLRPSPDSLASSQYYTGALMVDCLSDFNLCSFVLEWLTVEIEIFKSAPRSSKLDAGDSSLLLVAILFLTNTFNVSVFRTANFTFLFLLIQLLLHAGIIFWISDYFRVHSWLQNTQE